MSNAIQSNLTLRDFVATATQIKIMRTTAKRQWITPLIPGYKSQLITDCIVVNRRISSA